MSREWLKTLGFEIFQSKQPVYFNIDRDSLLEDLVQLYPDEFITKLRKSKTVK